MAGHPNGILQRLLHRRSLARWVAAARGAEAADLSLLRAQRQQARQLRAPLQELTYIADSRLALPRIGSTSFARPAGTDWSWRPQAWRAGLPVRGMAPAKNKAMLGSELTVFHDCKTVEIGLRQIRSTDDQDLAPFGVALEVFDFDGSFLSLVIDLPPAACQNLRKRHLIRLSTMIESEAPAHMIARLNVKHGPNTQQDVQNMHLGKADAFVEFDLSSGDMNEARVERMWVDLMFPNPRMNCINIRDLNFARYPRAAL